MNKNLLTPVDIQLYLAHALPWHKRLFITMLAQLSPKLKQQIQHQQKENLLFSQNEKRTLQHALFPTSKNEPAPSFITSLFRAPAFKPAFSLVLVCMIALPLYFSQQSPVEFTAKGSGLGINLYKKEADYKLLADEHLTLQRDDTLQIMPIGKSTQFFALYTYSADGSLQKIFPEMGTTLAEINSTTLPPALIFDGEDAHLICVSSLGNRPLTDIQVLLTHTNASLDNTITRSQIIGSLYIQAYTITAGGSNE